MRLQVLSRYRNGRTEYTAGQIIDATDEEAARLKRDSPGSFEEYMKPKPKAIEKPPADKMLRRRGARVK